MADGHWPKGTGTGTQRCSSSLPPAARCSTGGAGVPPAARVFRASPPTPPPANWGTRSPDSVKAARSRLCVFGGEAFNQERSRQGGVGLFAYLFIGRGVGLIHDDHCCVSCPVDGDVAPEQRQLPAGAAAKHCHSLRTVVRPAGRPFGPRDRAESPRIAAAAGPSGCRSPSPGGRNVGPEADLRDSRGSLADFCAERRRARVPGAGGSAPAATGREGDHRPGFPGAPEPAGHSSR